MRLVVSMAFAVLTCIPAVASPKASADFGVFCVRGRLQVDQKRIEELKSTFGEDVCRLEQDATETGAREKAHRLGGVGSTCLCE